MAAVPSSLSISTAELINAAFTNGPDLLIQTVNKQFGIPIDHYVQVNFDGFKGIVNAIGGINVYFPSPARDTFSVHPMSLRAASGCVGGGPKG